MNGRNYRDSLVNIFSVERSSQESRGFSHERFKDALKYVEIDENAKEIFEFNDEDTELLGCVWSRDRKSKCITCGTDMIHSDTNSDDSYVEYEFICPKCNTTACFKV